MKNLVIQIIKQITKSLIRIYLKIKERGVIFDGLVLGVTRSPTLKSAQIFKSMLCTNISNFLPQPSSTRSVRRATSLSSTQCVRRIKESGILFIKYVLLAFLNQRFKYGSSNLILIALTLFLCYYFIVISI